jgi:hypothetical protein
MSEFEDIQRLIQLKRFEQPGEGFAERLPPPVSPASAGGDAEAVIPWSFFGSASLLGGDNLLVPKWGMVAAAVAVCAMSIWMLSQPAAQSSKALTSVPAFDEKPFIPKMDLSDLPLARMAERDEATLADMLLRKHLEVRPALEGSVSPLPANGWQVPSLQHAVPAIHDGADGGLGR